MATFLAAMLAFFAWATFTDNPESAEPPAATTTTTTLPEPSGPRVLDPGSEPRQVLRLGFNEGEQISFRTVTDLEITQTSDEQEHVVDTPGVIQTVAMTVDRVHAGGAEADISFEVTEATVFPDDRFSQQTMDEMNLSLAALVGVGGSGRMASTGEVLSFDYSYDGDNETVQRSLEQLTDQIEGLTPAFPTEPLGVGARWEVETVGRGSGITFSQLTTYELTEISDDAIEFTSTVAQTADPQDLDLSDAERARLVSYSATGGGSGLFTLSSLVASGTTTLTGTQVITLTPTGGSEAEEIELTQELVMEIVVDVIW